VIADSELKAGQPMDPEEEERIRKRQAGVPGEFTVSARVHFCSKCFHYNNVLCCCDVVLCLLSNSYDGNIYGVEAQVRTGNGNCVHVRKFMLGGGGFCDFFANCLSF
jgi:hypothetical protein